jgi:hypothetical protein
MITLVDVIGRVRISDVWSALGGGQLRRGRGQAFWRDGDGFNVSVSDQKGCWYDFVTGDGGGVLALVQRVRGGTRAEALRWIAEFAGVPLGQPVPSQTRIEHARRLQERGQLDCELPKARHWRRAALAMSEELLKVLKMAIFDQAADVSLVEEIQETERLLSRLRRVDGAELVGEYHWWAQHYLQLTMGMIRASETLELAEQRALHVYLSMTVAEATSHETEHRTVA